MSHVFKKSGTSYFPIASENATMHERLDPAIYAPRKTQEGQPYLEKVAESLPVFQKYYGDADDRFTYVSSDFELSGRTSALFVGSKGCGKTIEIERIAEYYRKHGMPVIYVDEPIDISVLNYLLSSVRKAVWVFDEFGKLFKKSQPYSVTASPQELLLTTFAGAKMNGSILLISENDVNYLDDHMLSRPGRVKFLFRFNKPGLKELEEIFGAVQNNTLRNYLKLYFRQGGKWGYDTINVIAGILQHNPDTSVDDFIKSSLRYNIPPPIYLVITPRAGSSTPGITSTSFNICGDIFKDGLVEMVVTRTSGETSTTDVTAEVWKIIEENDSFNPYRRFFIQHGEIKVPLSIEIKSVDAFDSEESKKAGKSSSTDGSPLPWEQKLTLPLELDAADF